MGCRLSGGERQVSRETSYPAARWRPQASQAAYRKARATNSSRRSIARRAALREIRHSRMAMLLAALAVAHAGRALKVAVTESGDAAGICGPKRQTSGSLSRRQKRVCGAGRVG